VQEVVFLRDLVVVLAAAVLVVTLLRRLGVPSIAGFILAGVLAGPTALGLVQDTHEVEVLAEIGVVLLLFGIGLELSLDRLRLLWKAVLVGGGIQVTATVALATAISHAMGLSWGAAIFFGFIVAVSSTAIVLRGLSQRGELNAPHGRLAVGILVFQDLCVVLMILAVPFLVGEAVSLQNVLMTTGTAVGILGGVLIAGNFVVPQVLNFVAKTRDQDLFVLTVFLICLGIAWGVSKAGISLALGAFLAGLTVASSEFRYQALSDLIPTREVFASLFFVSVGMLLDVSDVLAHVVSTVGLLVAILVGKSTIILATALILRLPLRIAILSAAALSQVGEFSFVLLHAGPGILDSTLSHNLLVAIILSMLLTPLGLASGPRLATNVMRIPWLNRRLGANPPGVDASEPHSNHVVVAGYGLTGHKMCEALREHDVPYIAVDVNPDNVRAARKEGHRVVLGDVTRSEVLSAIATKNARMVVMSINDTRATELAIRAIRNLAPGVMILARAHFEIDKDSLLRAGADQVITAEATASDSLTEACLEKLSVE